MDTEEAIRAEIEKALSKLGKSRAELTQAITHREPGKLGFDRHLVAVVGSWGDTLDDAEVLKMLREWNQTGRLELDELYASTRQSLPGSLSKR